LGIAKGDFFIFLKKYAPWHGSMAACLLRAPMRRSDGIQGYCMGAGLYLQQSWYFSAGIQ
jgi:hypothetical protein